MAYFGCHKLIKIFTVTDTKTHLCESFILNLMGIKFAFLTKGILSPKVLLGLKCSDKIYFVLLFMVKKGACSRLQHAAFKIGHMHYNISIK